ncbi:MAG: Hsp20/alpha crystallin family protein [Candidatus Acidiferrales bacterium]
MTNKPLITEFGEVGATNVRIGDATECRKAISDAVAKRAYEIYERSGRQPGCDRKNWSLAENEILKPLSCGVLKSQNGVNVSMCSSSLSAKDIEVCVEPHRLIVLAHKDSNPTTGDAAIYRVLPLADEIEPSSVRLRAHGGVLEIKLGKTGADKKPLLAKVAA